MTFFLGGSIFFLGLYTFFSGNIFLKISISLKISLDSPSIYCIALGLTALVYIIDAAPRPRLRVPLQEFFFFNMDFKPEIFWEYCVAAYQSKAYEILFL